MIFGPCRETSHTAITLNPESKFNRWEKNHSLFHWSTLTCPELLIRIWMSSKRNASMIIGILMGHETCLILGQVSHNLLYWKKKLPTDILGPGRRLTCDNSERILPTYLPYWMCVQSSFYHQLWINTWRSEFKQETDSILPACWSQRQRT